MFGGNNSYWVSDLLELVADWRGGIVVYIRAHVPDETCRDREAGRHVLRLYCFVVALSCSPHLRFVKMLYTVQLFSSGADYVSIGLTREYWRRAEGTTPVGGSWADTHTVKALTTL